MKYKIIVIFFVFFLCLRVNPVHSELPDFTDLAEEGGPAVVNISTVKKVETADRLERFFGPFRDNGGHLEEFFREFFGDRPQRERRQTSLGSGFIISEDGYIVTNNHVIEKAEEIKVNLYEKEDPMSAEIVGRDPETDLALLKIDVDRELPVLEFGDSEQLQVGQWVLAIGNPFGLEHTVTAGIISAKSRVIGAGPYDDFLQTDASINPGNSGGPLLNMQGEVVGINTAIVAAGQGIGFAVPSDKARRVIDQLKEFQKVKRGWLGVTIQDMDEHTARALDLPEERGALVASAREGDPAYEAGLRSGDVILELNGQEIEDAADLTRKVGRRSPGEEVQITYWRDAQEHTVQLVLGERDIDVVRKPEEERLDPEKADFLGMQLKEVGEEEARNLGLPQAQGLLVTDLEKESPAARANMRPGDVILQANGQDVNQPEDFLEILEGEAADKGVVMLLVHRQGQNLIRTIPID